MGDCRAMFGVEFWSLVLLILVLLLLLKLVLLVLLALFGGVTVEAGESETEAEAEFKSCPAFVAQANDDEDKSSRQLPKRRLSSSSICFAEFRFMRLGRSI